MAVASGKNVAATTTTTTTTMTTADAKAKTPTQHTPGRKGRTGNQYFDVGKVGRKTGITLKDTGIRDEFGMEPMVGIFSSPVKEEHDAGREGVHAGSSEGTGMLESEWLVCCVW